MLRATPTPGVVQKIPLLMPGSANCAASRRDRRGRTSRPAGSPPRPRRPARARSPAAAAAPATASSGCTARTAPSAISWSGAARISRRSCPAQKCLPGAREDHHLDRVVVGEPVDLGLERGEHRRRQWIHALAAVERQRRDASADPRAERTGASTSVFDGAFMASLLLDGFHRSRLAAAARTSGSCRSRSWAARRTPLRAAP